MIGQPRYSADHPRYCGTRADQCDHFAGQYRVPATRAATAYTAGRFACGAYIRAESCAGLAPTSPLLSPLIGSGQPRSRILPRTPNVASARVQRPDWNPALESLRVSLRRTLKRKWYHTGTTLPRRAITGSTWLGCRGACTRIRCGTLSCHRTCGAWYLLKPVHPGG